MTPYVTLSELREQPTLPRIPKETLRAWVRDRRRNGLDGVVRKGRGRWYVDLEKFEVWFWKR